ncbi:unnamed protein product [Tuber aestivum]|uniref:Uncharacterized protein n=1 Tax=Tuber aestivum TaxID=59557 RepID=A0A292PR48_9PEZI|nr:unnamed protein product [Tuber aestivum]
MSSLRLIRAVIKNEATHLRTTKNSLRALRPPFFATSAVAGL